MYQQHPFAKTTIIMYSVMEGWINNKSTVLGLRSSTGKLPLLELLDQSATQVKEHECS
jgi:hypothetical protein